MKSNNNYVLDITYKGSMFRCEVNGTEVAIISKGWPDERMYESLRYYLEEEGFIKELDERKGILDLFK
jgi:hypothetical protein